MKYVLVPPPIAYVHPFTKEALPETDPLTGKVIAPQKEETLWTFLRSYLCSSEKLGNGFEGARRARKFELAFEETKPGDIVGIEDEDYRVAINVFKSIVWKNPLVGAQLLPFFEAFEDAEKQDEAWKKKKQSLKEVPATA